jgi:exonuclease SbcD
MPAPEFRFVHAADLHLDTPFTGIGRVAPRIAARLRDASLETFDALIAMSIEREAAFVIFAGDIYNAADRGVRPQLRFLRGVERLGERGIHAFVAHGNHDPLDGWSAVRSAPANLTVFASAVETHPVIRRGELLAQVYGVSYPRRDVTENLALGFHRQEGPGLHIGVLHCNAGGQPDHPAYSACSVADLAAAGMDYWALGHVHRRLILADRPWIVYPGNPQACRSSELGARGAALVTASGGAVERVDFIDLDRVRFMRAEVDISGEQDLHGLRKTILSQASSIGRDSLLTVMLTGRGALHGDLRRAGAVEDLLRDLRDELGEASPFVWIDRIVDRTRAELDRVAIRGRGDFSADLTRLVDGLKSDPAAVAGLMAELSLRARYDPGGAVDVESLLDEAEERALDLLESEMER